MVAGTLWDLLGIEYLRTAWIAPLAIIGVFLVLAFLTLPEGPPPR